MLQNNKSSKCVLIGQQVCFHSAMKHENDVTIWLTVSEIWEFTVRTSYIVFLFVKTENDNFIKEIKHVVRASIACWKPRQSSTASRVFTDLLSNSPKRSPQFSSGYEGTEKHVLFLNSLIKSVLLIQCLNSKKKQKLYSVNRINFKCTKLM